MSSVCQAPLRRTLPLPLRRHSVPETAPYGTEYACRAQKGLLRNATRFQKHSVRKTGFYGTEEIFGAKNRLLWYAAHFQRCAKRHPVTPDAFSKARSARTVAAACVYCGGGAFFKKNKKRRCIPLKSLRIHPLY